MARKEDSKVTRRVNRRLELSARDQFDFPRRPKNILWYLVHRYLFRGLRMNRLETWDAMLKRYVLNPKNGVTPTPEARTSERGNLTSQIFSEDEGMSINTFAKTAVVAEAIELEIIAIWKFPKGKRIVGKVRYPLNPDVLMSLRDEDEETAILTQISDFLQQPGSQNEHAKLEELAKKLLEVKRKKSINGESND